MVNNYLHTLLRNVAKSKAYSLINITGLSIGMAAALLIILWVENALGMLRWPIRWKVCRMCDLLD